MIDAALLKTLLIQGAPALSVYFPIHRAGERGADAGQRLRGLVRRAGQALSAAGVGGRAAREMLGALDETADWLDLADQQDRGFGYFATADWSRMVTLPVAIPETVVVAPDFHVKPMLPLLARNRRFHVLALSTADARLYAATPYAWDELMLDIPLETLDPEGPHADLCQAVLLDDMSRVAQAVRQTLADDAAPLLLVADAMVAGHFVRLPHAPPLFGAPLLLDPFTLSPASLHARATERMQPLLDAEPEAVLEQAAPGVSVEEILAQARAGRVEAIVVAEDQSLAAAREGREDAQPDPLNEAAVETLRHGGCAYALPLAKMPHRAPALAIYRV